MRDFTQQAFRIFVTILGLAMFSTCLYKLVLETRVEILPDPEEVVPISGNEAVIEGARANDPRPIIMIDAGHGGMDGGAVGSGFVEKNLSLVISKRVVSMLQKDGRFRIEMTRKDDKRISLEDRVAMANDMGTLLFVSIHLNTGQATSAHGVETWYTDPKPFNIELAEKSKFRLPSNQRFNDDRGQLVAKRVQDAVCKATGARDRGLKIKGNYVTKYVQSPSILIECGFLTNPGEAKKLADLGYQERIARGIKMGVVSYLEDVIADPMYGIEVPNPIKPESERILSQSAKAGS